MQGGEAGRIPVLGEWAYLMEEEDGDGGSLMSCLVAAKQSLASANPGPPPGLKPPQQFNIFTPQKQEAKPTGELTQWCGKHGVPEVADTLTYNGLRAIAEIAILSDAQLETVCGSMSVGTCARLKLAVQSLRQTNLQPPVEEPGSGWVDAQSGRELPLSMMRGWDASGPELLMSADRGVAFVQLPGRGWIDVRKLGELSVAASPTLAPQHSGAPMYSPPGFGAAGPLEKFASTRCGITITVVSSR